MKIGGKNVAMATYGYDIIIIDKIEDQIKNKANVLIEKGKSIGLK